MTLFPDILIIARAALTALAVLCGVLLIGFTFLPPSWRKINGKRVFTRD